MRTGTRLSVTVPVPSWPAPFQPHAYSDPSVLTASECPSPAATVSNPVPTSTGKSRRTVVPSPSCPRSFEPQPQSDPSVFTATVWALPAATCLQPSPQSTTTPVTSSVVATPAPLNTVQGWPVGG